MSAIDLKTHIEQISNHINNQEFLNKKKSVIFAPDLKNDCGRASTIAAPKSRFFLTHTTALSEQSEALKKQILVCQKCEYHKTRKKAVAGCGSAKPLVMFVGKAPKEDEDETGIPFAGEPGEIIKNIVEKVLLIKMDDIYITNVVKCKPDKSTLMKKNVEMCKSYLVEEIKILKPSIICAMGNEAAKVLIGEQLSDSGITTIHGNIYYYNDIPVILTLNPSAFIAHNDPYKQKKRMVFEDMKKLKSLIEKMK